MITQRNNTQIFQTHSFQENEVIQFPEELNTFLKKVERIKTEMNRIEQHNIDLQMKTDDILLHFFEKKNEIEFQSLFSFYFIFLFVYHYLLINKIIKIIKILMY